MTEKLRIGERIHERSVRARSEEGRLEVETDGRAHDVVQGSAAGGRHNVVIDGERETLFTARSPDGVWVWWKGHGWLVSDVGREPRRSAGPRSGSGGAAVVTPSTPAVVTAIMVKVGEDVATGQTLVVVTAMKMETCLTAQSAGRVLAINTVVGAKVRPGEILVEIGPRNAG